MKYIKAFTVELVKSSRGPQQLQDPNFKFPMKSKWQAEPLVCPCQASGHKMNCTRYTTQGHAAALLYLKPFTAKVEFD